MRYNYSTTYKHTHSLKDIINVRKDLALPNYPLLIQKKQPEGNKKVCSTTVYDVNNNYSLHLGLSWRQVL